MKVLTKTEAQSKIRSIKGRSSTLVKDIHAVAFSALAHAEQHGDTTLMDSLYSAVSNGHKTGLVIYFKTFGPILFNKKEKTFRKHRSEDANPWDLDTAAKTSPDDLDRELHAKTTQFDEYQQLRTIRRSLAKRVMANIEKTGEIHDEAMGTALASIDLALAKMKTV